jgi:hypothetical protein
LLFLSGTERERFRTKFLEVKQKWHQLYQASETTAPVNRMPDGAVRLPPDIGSPPVPKNRAELQPSTSPRNSLVKATSLSSASITSSGRNSTHEEPRPNPVDTTRLMVPPDGIPRRTIGRRRPGPGQD